MKNNIIQTYLNRFAIFAPCLKDFTPSFINIIIPACREEELVGTLESLDRCYPAEEKANVLVVLNHPDSDREAEYFHVHQKELLEKRKWNNFRLYVMEKSFPEKIAGVGMARKAGMDEVIHHCTEKDLSSFLICLDADCLVSENYLKELYQLRNHADISQVVLNFSHCYEKEKNKMLKEGIIRYELFLRYYRYGLQTCGFPFAYHTIGSAMGCRIKTYVSSGGMNRRKAGEDFYFLGKLFPLGRTMVLNSLCIFPSCRISERVPFGTGMAQKKFSENQPEDYPVYHPDIFSELKKFFNKIFQQNHSYDELHPLLREYLKKMEWEKMLSQAECQSKTNNTLMKRIFRIVDVFFILKAVHFLRDNGGEEFKNIPILEAAKKLYRRDFQTLEESLEHARQADDSGTGNFDFFSHF